MKKIITNKVIIKQRIAETWKFLFRTLSLMWLYNSNKYKKTFHKFYRSFQSLPLTRNPKLTKSYNPNRKYIYFPLHLQPEMTTDSLGGPFADQILAIEKVCSLIPKDWVLYCKENPKQTRFMRNDDFYFRLASIPNADIVHVDTSTFDLIKNAQFIATISGTAGWEALRMGKKVLLFGDVWYQELHGVYKFNSIQTIDDLKLSEQISRKKLTEDFDNLTHYLHCGVINKAYKPMVANFNETENAKIVFKSINTSLSNT